MQYLSRQQPKAARDCQSVTSCDTIVQPSGLVVNGEGQFLDQFSHNAKLVTVAALISQQLGEKCKKHIAIAVRAPYANGSIYHM
jgi:hypothetical protein